MKQLKPKLLSIRKGYWKNQFVKDLISGLIVAIVAMPLSIALALASGVSPEQGLYTSIVGGFVVALLGGSKVQVSGPTAALATIVAGTVAKNGMQGLILATMMAGVILVIMGFCRMGSMIRYIPYTITTGFTSGIAVSILIGQLKDFFGVTYDGKPIAAMDKLRMFLSYFGTFKWEAIVIGLVSLAILIIWPKITEKVSAYLIAILITSALVKCLNINVATIGSLYDISNKPPMPSLPGFDFNMAVELLPDAFTIAILGGIVSLLSCVVTDGMIGERHDPNMELVAQGAGNVASALFGGIPVTGAVARSIANVKNGGRTPVASMVHTVVLLAILVLLIPFAKLIPMPCMAAILFQVAYNMSGWREFVRLVKNSPKSDTIVLVTTFILTFAFDIVLAIEVGIVLAAMLFMKRMSDVTQVTSWKYLDSDVDADNDPDAIRFKKVPKNTLVYEINGPMFFAAADQFLRITTKPGIKCVIIRMRSVPAMDVTALRTLENIHTMCKKQRIQLVFSHVTQQPMAMMEKAGFVDAVGEENFRISIDDALEYASTL